MAHVTPVMETGQSYRVQDIKFKLKIVAIYETLIDQCFKNCHNLGNSDIASVLK